MQVFVKGLVMLYPEIFYGFQHSARFPLYLLCNKQKSEVEEILTQKYARGESKGKI